MDKKDVHGLRTPNYFYAIPTELGLCDNLNLLTSCSYGAAS